MNYHTFFNANALAKQMCAVFLLMLGTAFICGCEDDKDKGPDGTYSFKNESNQSVTLRTAFFATAPSDLITTQSLAPGASANVQGLLVGNTYQLSYDYEPKSSVIANELKTDRIVFSDRQ